LIAGPELAGMDEAFDLLLDLSMYGHGAGLVDPDIHDELEKQCNIVLMC
jgi:hypothetical protein